MPYKVNKFPRRLLMSYRLNTIVFTLSVICAIAVRSVMILFTIEPESGFIRPENTLAATIYIALLVLGGAAVFILALITKPKKTRTAYGGGLFFSASCLILAVAIIYETFFSSLLTLVNPMQKVLQYIFTILAACSLCFVGLGKFKGEKCNPLLAIVPIFFWLMRLIIIFSSFSTISSISDTVIETSGLCLSLITFLYFAKVESGQLQKKKYTIGFAVALLNSYVCFIASMPRIVCGIAAFQQPIHLNTVPILTGLATALFSACFAYRMLRVSKASQ